MSTTPTNLAHNTKIPATYEKPTSEGASLSVLTRRLAKPGALLTSRKAARYA
jgi:hypothetical protein